MKYGLIGEKLGHSFSKPIHEKIANYTYELNEIAPEDLDSFMCKKDFNGINVTIPYKSAVIPYLDYIDPIAEKIGAVNTVVNREGKLYGYNTDFGGLKMLIERSGFDYVGKKVLILGTGGTSKTAAAVAENLGAEEIIKVGRNSKVNYENLYSICSDADYIINTTPVGMCPDFSGCPVDVEEFSQLKGVTDVVYNPLKTLLYLNAEKKGVKCVCGLYMLVCQAVLACELFAEKGFNVKEKAEEIYADIVKEKRNIVLVGMPGSGKTTIGKELSLATGKKFVDTDEIITSRYGVISDIFALKGESFFREIEAEVVKEVSAYNGYIIATGGGAVLKEKNRNALRQNGVVFFLNRPLEQIVPTSDRPLSSNFEALKKRFEERYDIYVSLADEEIYVDGLTENSVNKILEKIR